MAKYLVKAVETWRVDSEETAKSLIEDAKKSNDFDLSKYSSEYKCKKVKGEIEEEWYRVTLTKDFTDEKEPDCTTTVAYNVNEGIFPSPVNTDDDEEGIEF